MISLLNDEREYHINGQSSLVVVSYASTKMYGNLHKSQVSFELLVQLLHNFC